MVNVNNYSFNVSIGDVNGSGKTVRSRKYVGECAKIDRGDVNEVNETLVYSMDIRGEGLIDPDNLNEIFGSKTNGNIKITWN